MISETIQHAFRANENVTTAGIAADLAAAQLASGPVTSEPVQEHHLAGLPPAAARYLRFMGVLGKPRDWSLAVRMRGSFRLSPRAHWMPMEAWQYDSALDIARVFHMRTRYLHLVPIVARDTYLRGKGCMQAKLFDARTVAEATGEQIDIGELVTYLNDAVLMAPSMLLNDNVQFGERNGRSFEVTLHDRGHCVTARVTTDEHGCPVNFSTEDRFVTDPEDPKKRMIRARWTTPIAGYRCVESRMLPTAATAVWHTSREDFAYVRVVFEPAGFAFNRAPGEVGW